MQKLLGLARKAISRYNMIQNGDKIAVGLSGGKDSIMLLATLAAYKKFAPEQFDLVAINIDLGFDLNIDEVEKTKKYCDSINVPLIIEKTDIAKIIFEERKEKSPCSLCSKMRRGALNTAAIKNGCNKLALGHHADDVLETMLLSLIYEGRFSTFMPVSYMDRTKMTLIRPFIYVEEKQIRWTCARLGLPTIFNPCPKDKHTQREEFKNLIQKLDEDFPKSKERMLSAIYNPDRNNLWDNCIDLTTLKKDK